VRRDPLILGAGPAGTAAAITLGRAGRRPVLIERSAGPTDKVCGDFLSLDAIEWARALGVDPAALGGEPIGIVRLTHGGQTAEAALPFPAMGLSRRTLDAALLRQAESAGAVVRTGQTVRRLTRHGNHWSVQIAGQAALTVETVFLATGKHDPRDLPRPGTQQGAIGMKMYFALAPNAARALTGATELTLFPGGYAGLQHVENGRSVLCIAVRRGAFQRYGGGWDGLVGAIGQRSRRFGWMLEGARALLPRPLAVAGIPYGYVASPDELFRLGDQAAVIPSLTGDGMAIALYSGQKAAEAWLSGIGSGGFQQGLARTLAPQMRLARLLHDGGTGGPFQATAVPIVRLFPGLLGHAATHTRLRRSARSAS
jgi:flavin-dependent dehydrogenase